VCTKSAYIVCIKCASADFEHTVLVYTSKN
jgi:hypothetical protein